MKLSIDIKWERKNNILVGMLDGRVDNKNAGELRNALDRVLDDGIHQGTHAMLLDFEKVSYMSSAGFRVILIIAKHFDELGKRFGICTLLKPISNLTSVTGFDKIISIYESQDTAIKALNKS